MALQRMDNVGIVVDDRRSIARSEAKPIRVRQVSERAGGNGVCMFKRRYAVLGFFAGMVGKRYARLKLRSFGRSRKHALPFA
jgi:hypothetical protein